MYLVIAARCSGGSIFGTVGVCTKLRYQRKPIHMMPAMMCSQRKKKAHQRESNPIHWPLMSPAKKMITIRTPTPAASVFSSDWKNAAMIDPPHPRTCDSHDSTGAQGLNTVREPRRAYANGARATGRDGRPPEPQRLSRRWVYRSIIRRTPMSFTLPELPYAYDALAPYMSRETLEYHHDKHHLAYVNAANKLVKGSPWEGKSLEDLVKGSFGKNAALFNNAAQHYNHLHFWQWMKPNGGGDKIPGNLEKKIVADLGSVEKMKGDFVEAGVSQFGSGWCWLAVKGGKIVVMKTPNGENPLVHGGKPILGCDVWEHSYYIDYRNRRPDYLKAFVDHLINWEYVAKMFDAAMHKMSDAA